MQKNIIMETKKSKKDFKFFMPVSIEKSKDDSGEDIMKIAGVASTADKDSDGEILDPSGFDLSFFRSNGFINWHHQSKNQPSAIIGEPTLAEIRDKGLYVEGKLYKNSALAKDVFELAKGLKKENSNRKLGFSIEGKVLERDALDNSFVKRAKITGLAITPTPKNANTLVNIIKGEYNEVEKDEVLTIENLKANGGSQNIIDITKPNGDKIVVDNMYNIKVMSKGTDISNAGVLAKESLDDEIKDQKSGAVNKKNIKFTTLNKSQLFSEIIKITDDFEITEKILKAINIKDMSEDVTLEKLKKALNGVGLPVDENILKSSVYKDEEEDKTSEKKEEESFKKEVEKKEVNEEETEAPLAKKKKEATFEDTDEKKEEVEKKEVDEEEETEEELEASLAKKKKEMDIIKSKLAKCPKNIEKTNNEKIQKALEIFQKRESNIGEMMEMMKDMRVEQNKRFEALENQTPVRKSVISSRAIEKSFGSSDSKNNENKTSLSILRNKKQISNILLTKSGVEKGEVNDFYSDAMLGFEATGELSKSIIADLYTNSNILITE